MSTALEEQFNQVLRPYFALFHGNHCPNEAALDELFNRLTHDDALIALLRAAHPDFNQLLEQLPDDCRAQACHSYLVRFFGAYLARPLAHQILITWDSAAILALYERRTKMLSQYQAFGLNEDQAEFQEETLARTLIQLLAAHQSTAYSLSGPTVIDLSPNLVTILALSRGGNLKQVKLLASNPKAVFDLAQNKLLAQAIKIAASLKTGATKIQASILKGLLAQVSYQKVYFNAQGQQFVGRAPAGTSVQDFYTTFKLPDLVTSQKGDLLKVNLSEGHLKLLSSPEMGKLYRHGLSVALGCGYELPLNGSPAFATLDSVLGDSKLVLAAVNTLRAALANSSKSLDLKLTWQYEPTWPCLNQLVITATEPQR